MGHVRMQRARVVRPDAKGRIVLGNLARGISSFRVTVDRHNNIVLEPFSEVPAREKWLFDNPEALSSVRRGLLDAAQGRVVEGGSFAHFVEESDDD